jgi:DNA-binding transcriptional MerR regulator
MKMSELSRASGVPVATIKYYLRERLLPAGRATAATQAQYDDEHVARLRLIRALVDVGRLPLAAVRDVLAVVDAGADATPAAVGTAHDALPPRVTAGTQPPRRALAALDLLGWQVDAKSSSLQQLEAALAAVEAVGLAASEARLRAYGEAALEVARVDVADVPRVSAADAVQYVVIGTVLYEPVLLALRRLAQQYLFTAPYRADAEGPRPGGRVPSAM